MSDSWITIIGTPFAIRRDALDERQAIVNHSQTLDRLNQRGGIAATEAWAISAKQPYGMDRKEKAAWEYLIKLAPSRTMTAVVSFGVGRIAAERRRQVEDEGWTAEHDGNHNDFDLPAAASAYAYFASLSAIRRNSMRLREDPEDRSPQAWPWESTWWKPGADNSPASRIRELEKAGALIAAEIDRLAARMPAEVSHG